jgi:hypothetical protein
MASEQAGDRREHQMISGLTFTPLAAQFSLSIGSSRPVPVPMPTRMIPDSVLCGKFTDDAKTQLDKRDGMGRSSLAETPECERDQ